MAPDLSLDVYAVADQLGRLRRDLDAAERRADIAERELADLLATRTLRTLAPARRLYGRMRQRRVTGR